MFVSCFLRSAEKYLIKPNGLIRMGLVGDFMFYPLFSQQPIRGFPFFLVGYGVDFVVFRSCS